jgi:hypothetical protein
MCCRRGDRNPVLQLAGSFDVVWGFHQYSYDDPGSGGADADYFAVVITWWGCRIHGNANLRAPNAMMAAAHISYMGVGVRDHDVPIPMRMIHWWHINEQITVPQVVPA